MSAPPPRPKEVLIVDDSEPTAKALAQLLIRDGFEPAAFTCGEDALKYLNVGSPSAAVIDIHLPDVSGLVISQHLRDRYGPDIPIIIISGDSSLQNLSSLSLAGATHFYSKPIKASDLLARLRQLLPS